MPILDTMNRLRRLSARAAQAANRDDLELVDEHDLEKSPAQFINSQHGNPQDDPVLDDSLEDLQSPESLITPLTHDEDAKTLIEMAVDRWKNPLDYGNDHTGPMPLEEANRRYAFIPSALSKNGIDDPEITDQIVMAYADYRRTHRLAYYTEGQVDGWRFAALDQSSGSADFIGVDDVGLIHHARVHRHYGYSPEEDPTLTEDDLPFDLSFTDPLQATIDIAGCVKTNRRLKGVTISISDEDSKPKARVPLIIQSHAFRTLVEGCRDSIFNTVVPDGFDEDIDHEASSRAAARMSNIAMRDEVRRYGAMTNALMKSLNPETQKTLRSLGMYGAKFANWMSGRNEEGEADPDLSRNRLQAIKAYPLMGKTMMSDYYITRAIDRGEPLAPVLASALTAKPKTLSRLQGVTWQKAGRAHFNRPGDLVRILNEIDPNHIPVSRRGFSDLLVTHEAAEVLSRSRDQRLSLLQGVGGNFAKIGVLAEGNPPRGMNDMRQSLEDQLFAPALVQALMKRGVETDRVMDLTLSSVRRSDPLEGLSVRNALQNSQRWHRNERLIRDQLVEFQDDSWKPLVGEVDLGGGTTAVELRSTEELKTEGMRQDHCVGGYTESVLEGRSLIFSIRNKEGATLSTVEFGRLSRTKPVLGENGEKRNVRDISLEQNYGYSNDDPTPEATKAAKALQRRLNALPDERWDSYGRGLDEAVAETSSRKKRHSLERRAGYDVSDRGKLEKAWNILSEYLPRGERKKGLDGWIATRIEPIAVEVTKPRNHSVFAWDDLL